MGGTGAAGVAWLNGASARLNLFPWGYYARSQKAAVRLHLLLSLQGNLPAWAAVTEPHFPDCKTLGTGARTARRFLHHGPQLSGFCRAYIDCTKPVRFS